MLQQLVGGENRIRTQVTVTSAPVLKCSAEPSETQEMEVRSVSRLLLRILIYYNISLFL